MKTTLSTLPFFLLLLFMSSCFYEAEVEAPYVEIYNTEEYETQELIRTYSDRYGTYREYAHKAWIEVDLQNTGGIRARNVSVKFFVYRGNQEYSSLIHVADLFPGESTTITYDTGFSFISDYDDFEVFVYWD